MSAFEEGRQARRDGKLREQNPYAGNAHLWYLWDDGWVTSDTMLRALGLT